MNKKNGIFIVLLIMFSCGIVVEKDISLDELQVIAPSDSVVVPTGELTFRWELLEGATNYELFVVSPGFSKIQSVALDTVFGEVNGHNVVFEPGDYEWSIRASNSAYFTSSIIRSFSVPDSSQILDLTEEVVTLFSPTSNQVWSSGKVIFTWSEVEKATAYHLLVATPSLREPLEIVFDSEISDNKHQLDLENGTYEWEVTATNKYSESDGSSNAFVVANP
ncbi:MAG: hypothetical protein ABJH72_16565 [Reichenbachiella sp.]|uniref:hypothetical protein n=1 Tax=Reichenbachiella sp. TaxID=2184521 RepID=UPI0032676FAF